MEGVKYAIAAHCENRLETGDLGVSTGTKGNGSAHQNDFRIDEDGMAYAIRAFTTLVFQGL